MSQYWPRMNAGAIARLVPTMIPVLTRVRAKTIEEFGELVRHSGEEYIHVLEGRAEVHTEFYDPIVLEAGESVYIDSNMWRRSRVG